MSLVTVLKEKAAAAIEQLYKIPAFADDILVNETKPEFEGNYTLVLFALVKRLKIAPDKLGNELGTYFITNHPELATHFNVIKGFLNLTINDTYVAQSLSQSAIAPFDETGTKIIVEYSSPNTNKPLHLGHLRNIFLGWSIAQILKETGHEVFKTCIVNDRGIHICKSMLAWEKFADGATPESTHTKGDHFVGDYYVRFNDAYKQEVET